VTRFGALVRGVFRRDLVLLRRYPLDTLTNVFVIYLFFALAFFGGQTLENNPIADSADALIVGFFLFTLTTVIYVKLGNDIVMEARWGTLEQLYMTPFGFGTVVSIAAIGNLLLACVYSALILGLMMVSTGNFLAVDVVTVAPLAILTLASAMGLGFLLTGISLLYKRILHVLQIFQIAFVAFIAAPVEQHEVLKLLPVSLGSHLVFESMVDGLRLWELPAADLTLLVVKAVAYLVLGMGTLIYCARLARKRGKLGHY
jgi:ABC-2 type transport system permease protein